MACQGLRRAEPASLLQVRVPRERHEHVGDDQQIDHVGRIGYSCPMTDVPRGIKGIAFLSFALSVSVVLLIHHYLSTWKCPIPQ